jgi:hypothetical protein
VKWRVTVASWMCIRLWTSLASPVLMGCLTHVSTGPSILGTPFLSPPFRLCYFSCYWSRILRVISSYFKETHPQGQALQAPMRWKLGLSAAPCPWEFSTKFSDFTFTRITLSHVVNI